MTPDQINTLGNFVQQRDSLTKEIGLLSVEKDSLLKELQTAGTQLDSIRQSVFRFEGSISEIEKRESEREKLVLQSLSDKEKGLLVLENRLDNLNKRYDDRVLEANTFSENLAIQERSVLTLKNQIVVIETSVSSISDKIGNINATVSVLTATVNQLVDGVTGKLNDLLEKNAKKTFQLDEREKRLVVREMVEEKINQIANN